MLLGANPFAGASIHADQPIIGLYLPIVQSIHAPLVNVVPATHGDTQVFDTGLVEIESVSHTVHVDPSPRLSAGHVVHTSCIVTAIAGHPPYAPWLGSQEHEQTLHISYEVHTALQLSAKREHGISVLGTFAGSVQGSCCNVLNCPSAQIACVLSNVIDIASTKTITLLQEFIGYHESYA